MFQKKNDPEKNVSANAAVPADDAPINEITLKVRFGETDMAGVVHHSNFFHWLEAGRFELLSRLFASLLSDDEEENFFPVVKARCAYLQSAMFGDDVTVKTYIKKQLSTKICLYYKVVKASDPKKVLAVASTEHVCVVNRKKLRLKWPAEIVEKIRMYTEKYPYVFVDGEEYEKKL